MNGTANPTSGDRIVQVALGARSYDVVIGSGLLDRAVAEITRRTGARRCGIVTDRTVAARHLDGFEQALASAKMHAGTVMLEPGEATKRFDQLAAVTEQLLAFGIERGDLVVALGGGVIGDLAGFAASILRRGVRFIQIPTTLLAQVDSSVGGKTGINTAQGKNLAGAFHQPALVLADLDTLRTLPARQMQAGYAEVVKYGVLGDTAFYDWLEINRDPILKHERSAVAHAVARSVEMKAAIVARDETETGDRMLLNLGHTFGHALEAHAGFSGRLLHGEAVAIGMCQALRFSEALQLCPPQIAARVAGHLAGAGLPTQPAQIPGGAPAIEAMLRLMAQDKKVQDGKVTLILARGIGQAFVTRDVGTARIAEFLATELGGGGGG